MLTAAHGENSGVLMPLVQSCLERSYKLSYNDLVHYRQSSNGATKLCVVLV